MTWTQTLTQLDQVAEDVMALLKKRRDQGELCHIVLAESCTAGLIAATLGRVPGVSEFLAGSAVVYQIATKARWLSVDESALVDPGPVSRIVAEQMADGVLRMTPHASISLSITGHLGPAAPADLDGIAWCGLAMAGCTTEARMLHLPATTGAEGVGAEGVGAEGLGGEGERSDLEEAAGRLSETVGISIRRHRQQLATLEALRFLAERLRRSN